MPIVNWERFLELLEDGDEAIDLCATELAITWRAAEALYVQQRMESVKSVGAPEAQE